MSVHRGAPGLHSEPEVLLPPGPKRLILASLVSHVLSSIPGVPDEPSARVAGMSVIGWMKGSLLSGFALDKAVLAIRCDGLLLTHLIEQILTCFHYPL